jgi:hypothetical protein
MSPPDWFALSDSVLKVFGASGTYTPVTGDPVAMTIELRRDVLREDEGGAFLRQTMAFFKSGQVTVKTGDRITVGDESWAVDLLDSDDGFMTSVVLGRRT